MRLFDGLSAAGSLPAVGEGPLRSRYAAFRRKAERSYFLFFRHHIFTRADHVDGSGVERVFDVYPVIFLDHPDARATVLSDLIDVGSLHQPHADICVP
jgi:hypothetical protein